LKEHVAHGQVGDDICLRLDVGQRIALSKLRMITELTLF